MSTLILQKQKRLVFATSIVTDQSAHPYSLTKRYSVGRPTSSSYLDIRKDEINVAIPRDFLGTEVTKFCSRLRYVFFLISFLLLKQF